MGARHFWFAHDDGPKLSRSIEQSYQSMLQSQNPGVHGIFPVAAHSSEFQHHSSSVIPHTSKILLKILARRLERKAELFLGPDQYRFKSG